MTLDELVRAFGNVPSLGWSREPSPLTALPALAKHLGLSALTVKRDDLLSELHGGTKVRKLDVLLASPPWSDAKVWVAAGAIGSGHLAATTAAAAKLSKQLEVHAFDEPLSEGVVENLAFIASGPTRLRYYRSRLALAVKATGIFRGSLAGVPAIPPGATTAEAVAGVARAGLELALQLKRGELELPDCIYVALGTGGTAAGLALGLGLAGVKVPVRAVAVVEWPLASAARLRRLVKDGARWLEQHGVPARAADAAKLELVRGHLGRRYGVPTAQSLAAVEVLRAEGVPCEPIYTGKAFAAVLADAAARRAGARVLYWSTVRRGPLPCDPGWRDRLPPRLAEKLKGGRSRLGRRLVIAGGLAGAAGLVAARVTGYPALPSWAGQVLAPWEAQVIAAAAEVLSGVSEVEGLTVAANVDRFLVPMPLKMRLEVHELLGLVEHGTTPLGLRLSRFTRLDASGREAYLLSLDSRGSLLAQAFRGLRDLVLMGTYQDPRAWPALGYRGPWPAGAEGPESNAVPFESFLAPKGAQP